jgi:hypothetical protein
MRKMTIPLHEMIKTTQVIHNTFELKFNIKIYNYENNKQNRCTPPHFPK